jgi:hypothetical protein
VLKRLEKDDALQLKTLEVNPGDKEAASKSHCRFQSLSILT